MFAQGFDGILAACRGEPADGRKHRGDGCLIETHKQDEWHRDELGRFHSAVVEDEDVWSADIRVSIFSTDRRVRV